jgi:ubiquinone/menaquinone biosynthesis C-methylase UbiE
MKGVERLIEPPAIVQNVPTNIKRVFQNGWNHPGRVWGWAKRTVHGEFADPAGRVAWRNALSHAVAGVTVGEAADMGTGPGTLAQLWAELGWRVTGLDFSPMMLNTATSAARERELAINFVEGDVETPPLGVRRFNVVSSRLVLFTLPHPGLAVRRWVEMLRPGGRLVLIGEDHPDRHGKPRGDRPERTRPPGAWHADEEYHDALAQLDFMHHDSKSLRVVMEAAGVDRVEYVPMHDVIAARNAMIEQEGDARVFRSQPFVLFGKKPA